MFKYLVVIFLSVSLLVQTFSKFIIMADYQLNRAYIAKNLCENRNKPWLHCNGKCQMMKKMRQEEKKDEDNPSRKTEAGYELYSCNPLVQIVFKAPTITPCANGHIIASSPVDRTFKIFHPPQTI